MRHSLAAIAAAAALLTGCTVGPNYRRPQVAVPTNFRAPQPLPEPQAASLADLKWWEVFQDPQLQELIRTALKQNYDVQIAATRILQEQAQLGITRGTKSLLQKGFPTGRRACLWMSTLRHLNVLEMFLPVR